MHYQKRDGSERFCALGVLCDMAEKEGVTPSQFFKNLGAWKYGERGFSFPPPEVVAWAGLDKDYGATGNVARMNDNGAPFASIADWIEKNL